MRGACPRISGESLGEKIDGMAGMNQAATS
jgi:hypothetical protein